MMDIREKEISGLWLEVRVGLRVGQGLEQLRRRGCCPKTQFTDEKKTKNCLSAVFFATKELTSIFWVITGVMVKFAPLQKSIYRPTEKN